MAAASTIFYKNDGTGIYAADSFSKFPTVESLGWSRIGYTFTSWNTMADGTGTSFAEGSFDPVPDETGYGAYYAIWEPLPPSYLNLEGLSHYTDLIMSEINGKIDIGGKAGAIAYGSVDSTSTSTAFTATVDGITELVDGTTVLLHNGVVTSTSGFTININGLGAKKCYNNLTNATRETTIFNDAYTMLFVYSTELDGGNGGWWLYRGYDSNTNTIGYQLRTNSGNKVASDTGYKYRIWLTQADGKKWVPINTSSSTNATSNRTLNTRPIDPFGPIVYRASNGTCSAGSGLGATGIWQQYTLTIGYSYMASGFSLVAGPVYLRCTPQSDGSAVMQDITQDLPSSKDGKIYILLGTAYSTTSMELSIEHPVYWYDGAGIRLWMGAEPSGANGFSPTVSVENITGGHEITITDAMGAHSFDIMDGMTILEYGTSTWADFIAAYEANKLIYCMYKVSSNDTRMAFLAYTYFASSHKKAEFQYYRTVSSKSATQQGDEVYIYTLENDSSWTTTVRQTYTKIEAGTGLGSTYNASTGTLTLNSTIPPATASTLGGVKVGNGLSVAADGTLSSISLPTVTSSDNGKILTVVNGAWAASELPVYDGTVV